MADLLPFRPGPVPATAGTAGPSVRELVARYEAAVAGRCTAAVEADRRAVLRSFVAFVGDLAAAACRPRHVEDWLASETTWRSAWTQRRNARHVLACFAWGVGAELIDRSPLAGLRLRLAAGTRRRPVEDAEFRALLRASDACFRRVLFFLRLSGARPDEAVRLTWADIRWGDGLAVLREHKTRHAQRRPRDRVIPLHPVLVRLLRWLQRRCGWAPRCFTNGAGRPWTRHTLGQRLARLRRRLGLSAEVCLYGLRHAFVTSGLIRGVPLATMAAMVGHTTTAMTEHYAHVARDRRELQRAVIEAVGRIGRDC